MTREQIHIGDMSHEKAIGILKLMLEAMEAYDGISPTPQRVNAMKMAIESLEQEPNISLEVYKQVAKERDIAIQQLHELGYEFGQIIELTTKKDCNTCTHSNETDGSNCYECVKDMCNNYEPTTKNDLGVDAISRQALLNATVKKSSIWNHITNSEGDNLEAIVSKLPSVTPIRPKGHWISHHIGAYYECSNCHEQNNSKNDNYCPNCGAKMDKKIEIKRKDDWIPVSERLPQKNVEVLATTIWDAVTIAEMFSTNDWFIHEGATNAEVDDIVAWMPLPKPYKESKEV